MHRWYGKLIGFTAGWLLTQRPLGALVGLLIGHAFDMGWLGGTMRADPWRELGLTRAASDAEVDLTWRRLISQCHPDKLVDATPEARAQAEKQARRINAAYDRIKHLRKRKD